jgi:hypothetical protein
VILFGIISSGQVPNEINGLSPISEQPEIITNNLINRKYHFINIYLILKFIKLTKKEELLSLIFLMNIFRKVF